MFKFIILLTLLAFVNCGKLPPFITRCKFGDDTCALDAANKALPNILEGYKPLRIRSFLPFKFEKIDLSPGGSLKVELLNGEAKNMNSTVLHEITFNENSVGGKGTLSVVVDTDYDVSGKLLILPVEGKGKAHIEMDNINIEFLVNLSTEERKGKKYFKMGDETIAIQIGAMRLHFENLFNGDKLLGDNVNAFINDNWQDVEKEFHGGLTALISSMINQAIRPIIEHIPIDEIVKS